MRRTMFLAHGIQKETAVRRTRANSRWVPYLHVIDVYLDNCSKVFRITLIAVKGSVA